MFKKGKLLIAFSKTQKVVYDPMPNFFISNTVSMPTCHFYGQMEKYIRNNKIVVPVNKEINWKVLTKHNKALLDVKEKLILHEGRNFPDLAWDKLAVNLVALIKAEQVSINRKKVLERELELV